MQRLALNVKGCEPEVSLAVRVSGSESGFSSTSSSEAEEESLIDEFLSSHGFEFVDGSQGYDRRSGSAAEGLYEHEGSFSDGKYVLTLQSHICPNMMSLSPHTC